MALHRDIHWIGRQWAVTGHGMQLIDQKLQGFFDIEVARLWDESLIETMHGKQWLNAADFDKGLAVARARYPQPPDWVAPPPATVPAVALKPVEPLPPVAAPAPPISAQVLKPGKLAPVAPGHPEPALITHDPIAPPRQTQPGDHMRFDGRARFVRPWRVWMKRQT
jgi:hypothetical protein